MAKVLLVYDDYAELMNHETNLKKVGFDVVGLTNEFAMGDQLLGLNPDIVVAFGQGPKVSSLSIGRKLKENNRWTGKTILIFSGNLKPAAAEVLKVRADLFLEAPVATPTLVTVICELLGRDPGVFIERLMRNSLEQESEKGTSSPMSFGKGGAAGSITPTAPKDESVFVRGPGAQESGESSHVKGKPSFELFPDVDLKSLESEILGKPNEPKPTLEKKPEGFVISNKDQDVGPVSSKNPLFDTSQVADFKTEKESSEFADIRDPGFADELLKPGTHQSSPVPELTTLGEVAESEISQQVISQIQNEILENQLLSSEKRQIYTQALSGIKLNAKSTVSRVESRKRQKELKKNWDMTMIRSLDDLRRQFVKALFKKQT